MQIYKSRAALLALLPVLIAPAYLIAQAQPATKAQPEFATVALPTYIDATGSANYGYLAPTLTDAIDASMQQKFDYTKANAKTVENATKKTWKPGKVPTDAEIKQLATATRSDYVIVGSYKLNKKKTRITFTTRVFVAPDKFIDVPPTTNAVDGTLFDATSKVAGQIVDVIETNALAEQAKSSTKPKTEGGKIALAKNTEKPPVKPEPEKPKQPEKKYEPSHVTRHSDRSIGVGLNFYGNYMERQTQFYRYGSSLTKIDADVYLSPFRVYGQIGLPSTPNGDAISTTFKNASFYMLGLEASTDFDFGWLSYGMNYRWFGNKNPAGVTVRDLLDWTLSFYLDSNTHIVDIGPVSLSLVLASYVDLMSISLPNTTATDLGLLWNIEADIKAAYLIPIITSTVTASAGTSLAIYDQTSESYISDGFGSFSLDGKSRSGKLSGLRFAVGIQKYFLGANFHAKYNLYPAITSSFQPVNSQNALKSTIGYFSFGADYRLSFGR